MAAPLGLLPPLALACLLGLRGNAGARLVALQLASSVAVLVLVAMSFAFGLPSILDLPLTLVVLSLPGTLVLAAFLERWL
jgi:multicomponent Na+:H+ antiporter subunit F